MPSVRLDDFQDLEDLAMFAAIVECGGLNAASRWLTIPKSRLSRHLAALERRYNVELVHRSTRSFAVTDVGAALYDKCKLLLGTAQDAVSLMMGAQGTPHGLLRVSAPVPLTNFWLAPLLPAFLLANPAVRLELVSRQPEVDLASGRLDLWIQIRPMPLPDSDLVMRQLGVSQQMLVASPHLLSIYDPVVHPAELERMPLIGFPGQQGISEWVFSHGDGSRFDLSFRPRLSTLELVALRTAALAGVGVAMLPAHFCRAALEESSLVHVLPEWQGPTNAIGAAFLSRRGLSSAARAFLDFVARELEKDSIGPVYSVGHPVAA